jgi:hypothetical protein
MKNYILSLSQYVYNFMYNRKNVVFLRKQCYHSILQKLPSSVLSLFTSILSSIFCENIFKIITLTPGSGSNEPFCACPVRYHEHRVPVVLLRAPHHLLVHRSERPRQLDVAVLCKLSSLLKIENPKIFQLFSTQHLKSLIDQQNFVINFFLYIM